MFQFGARREPSNTAIEDKKIPVESGTNQGCLLEGSFFNLGLCTLIEEVSNHSNASHAWYYDDGYAFGIKMKGPQVGYFVNDRLYSSGMETQLISS